MQKWRLAGNFLLYMLPFLAGALYLGTVFLKANKIFGRVYFADLSGAGLCGLAFLVAMYLSTPENLIVVPLILWFLGSMLWFTALANRRGALLLVGQWRSRRSPVTSRCRRCSTFRSSRCPTTRASPMRASFPTASASMSAPRRSDISKSIPARTCTSRPGSPTTPHSACRRCRRTPISGCISTARARAASFATCRRSRRSYYRFLPMVYPYLIKQAPDTFVVQFGGGISTSVALRSNSKTRHRRGGKSRGARRLPHRQGLARFHRRRAQQSESARHRLRRPALSRPHRGALRRHRPEPRGFRRPVEPRRLRHRREVSPIRARR